MKRLLCFTDGFMHGGAERQLVGLANLLQKKGYSVTLASYHSKNFYHPLMVECGLKYHYIACGSSQISKLWSVYKFFKHEKFDYVISYKGGSNVICCILRAFGMPFKLIVSERCLVYDFNSFQKKKFFFYRFADFIVPNSDAQKAFIVDHYPQYGSKTFTITNFTDTCHFVPTSETVFNTPLKVLVTARISYQKNIKRFIEAISLLRQNGIPVIVNWYGGRNYGEDSYADECFRMVKECKVDDIFRFHDATNNILAEYQKCDVFCLPSIFEGFPNVVCEAMSCGKPILCSDVCDNASIVQDGINGFLFDPTNIEDIVEKFTMLTRLTENEIKSFGAKSRELALKMFSEEVFVNKYINLIEK